MREPTAARRSVWLTGDRSLADQLRDGSYLPDTAADPDLIPPAVVAHAVGRYTDPGDLVVDPDCGSGTVLVEALRAGRHAVGRTDHVGHWRTARANITAAKYRGACADGSALHATPRCLASVRAAGLRGRVDLLMTAVRLRGQVDAEVDASLVGLEGLLRACVPLLAPTAAVIIVVRPHRHGGARVDVTRRVVDAGASAGLTAVDRCVALTGALRPGHVITRASLAQRRRAAQARAVGTPIMLPAHLDIVIFRGPADHADTAARAQAYGQIEPLPAFQSMSGNDGMRRSA